MGVSEQQRKCPDCGAEMVSQKMRYRIGGTIITILAVAVAIFGLIELISGERIYGLILFVVGAFLSWEGFRRAKSNSWFCPKCKTKEFK